MERSLAYWDGQTGYASGMGPSANPYRKFSCYWHDWDAGWCDAFNDDELWKEMGEYLEPRAAASPAAEGETEDHECVYENGDGVCRQCVELAKHRRGAASPGAECPHCDGEGVIEGDSGTSPCACQRDAQEGMSTFGPRKVQADEEELKMLQIFPLNEVAGRYWIGLGEDGRMYSGEVYWVKTGHDHPAHQPRIAWKVITGAIGEAWK
ncbi:gp43 [Burkholderia pseudomallei]|nr:gp43 [Burkholderia pseudomallei]